MSGSMRTVSRRWITPAGLALLHVAFLASVAVHLAIPLLLPEGARSDFGYFYRSAVEALRGGSPYEERPAGRPVPMGEGVAEAAPATETVFNLNPPFQTALMVPLARLPYETAMWLWYGLGLLAGVLAAFLTARVVVPGGSPWRWGPAGATVLLLFPPTLANAWLAQFGLLLTLLTAASFWLLDRRRMMAVGVVLGLGAGLKLFVGLAAVFFLVTRRWRALVGFAAAFAASVLVGGLVLGWESYPRYLDVLRQVDWHAWSWNVSVFGTASRALGSAASPGLALDRPGLGLLAGRIAALLLGAGYVALLLRRSPRDDRDHTLLGAFSLTCVLMILLSPLGWLYYLPAVLPSCALITAASARGGGRPWLAACTVAFFLLASVPQRPYPGPELASGDFHWWKAELPALGLVILAVAHVLLLWPRPRPIISGTDGTVA